MKIYMVGTLVKMENRLPEYSSICVRVSRNTFCKYSKRFKNVVNSYNDPDLLAVCSDAVKLASTPKKEKVLSPKLQAYLDKILKDIEDLDEKNN